MQNEMPFFESPEEAVRAAIQALGGAKKVGVMLWPDKSVDNAARLLLDCVNSSRAEKLELTQIMLVFSMAKDVGCHAPFAWFCAEVGYDAKPINKTEEVDRLTSMIESTSKILAESLAKLESIRTRQVPRSIREAA